MSIRKPRLALFADCFHEVNGVALTCRNLDGFARRRGLPLFCVRAGSQTRYATQGTVTSFELRRGPVSFPVDTGLRFDLMALRHLDRVRHALRLFRPDLIQVTGPGDIGILGVILARQLQIPLVASWHTNIHEFGARRLDRLLQVLRTGPRARLTNFAERKILDAATRFYRLAGMTLAPNPELVEMLENRTGKPSVLFRRGVDTKLFSPTRRIRSDNVLTLGFVGRITPEKNLGLLVELERVLLTAKKTNFRFMIVGQGGSMPWLSERMRHAVFPGLLVGEALARAYADCDIFVFPSRTDTFGNVVQEAMASGLPVVAMDVGGPRYLVRNGVSGFLAGDDEQFIQAVMLLMDQPMYRTTLGRNARTQAMSAHWDNVFETMYESYSPLLKLSPDSLHRPATLQQT